MTFPYQVGIAGQVGSSALKIEAALKKQFSDLNIDPAHLHILRGEQIKSRDRKAPFSLVFFGHEDFGSAYDNILDGPLKDSVPIFPVVNDKDLLDKLLPEPLRKLNAFNPHTDGSIEGLAAHILEAFRLLRPTRRLFISYRRKEAQGIAIQLYEALDERNFDVFLDTRSINPGEVFQEILWHRLSDTDVVVLLDTPEFQKSQWTMEELARSNALNVQVLQILWPNVATRAEAAFSEFFGLQKPDFSSSSVFTGPRARLKAASVKKIANAVESLRARAFAARYTYLVDEFCDAAREIGLAPVVQSGRYIDVSAAKGSAVVIPAVGVPDALLHQEIEAKFEQHRMDNKEVWLLYDERGLLDQWLGHLAWLNKYAAVQSVQVSECRTKLATIQ